MGKVIPAWSISMWGRRTLKEKGCHWWDLQDLGLKSAFLSLVHLLGLFLTSSYPVLSGTVVFNLLPYLGMEMRIQGTNTKILFWEPHILPGVNSMTNCIPHHMSVFIYILTKDYCSFALKEER
jgi:hypothetical protein